MSGGFTIGLSIHTMSCNRTNNEFSRFALECKLGRCLGPGETVDHVDRNRCNNSFANLVPRSKLFQANNQSLSRVSPDTNFIGVCLQHKYNRYVATVRILTVDGKSTSKTLANYFYFKIFGK
jgi:hypothetical protein